MFLQRSSQLEGRGGAATRHRPGPTAAYAPTVAVNELEEDLLAMLLDED